MQWTLIVATTAHMIHYIQLKNEIILHFVLPEMERSVEQRCGVLCGEMHKRCARRTTRGVSARVCCTRVLRAAIAAFDARWELHDCTLICKTKGDLFIVIVTVLFSGYYFKRASVRLRRSVGLITAVRKMFAWSRKALKNEGRHNLLQIYSIAVFLI